MSDDCYQLVDFGDGRKLESLAGYLIDRPSPAAEYASPRAISDWPAVDARYDGDAKSWMHRRPWPDDLSIDCGSFAMPARPTPAGHIGIFPEQSENWAWLGKRNADPQGSRSALNLFGYTGASTMALVMAGYAVAHVDAAKPNVQAVREAAALNGIPDAPIRYLVDDAAKFAAREVRRQRRYHTIVLDPPAYGHSPTGKTWRLERDLWPLLQDCFRLMTASTFRLMITGHSPEVDCDDVLTFLHQSEFLSRADASSGLLLESGQSQLRDSSGRALNAGFFVRVQSKID